MTLISLVYVSTSVEPITQADLEDILAKSRRNNAQNGITGLLLYRSGLFIQVLEGEEDAVLNLYRKITRDPRHAQSMMLQRQPVAQRSFAGWSMGFNYIDDAVAGDLEGYSDYLQSPHDLNYFTVRPSRAAWLIDAFKHRTSL
jgi:hypothetical protein